jgi:hypothetical protein
MEYPTFNIRFSTILENGKAEAKVYFSDKETQFEDVRTYELDLKTLEEHRGDYIDNIAEGLMTAAIDNLIEQKKEYRKGILNAYDDIQS